MVVTYKNVFVFLQKVTFIKKDMRHVSQYISGTRNGEVKILLQGKGGKYGQTERRNTKEPYKETYKGAQQSEYSIISWFQKTKTDFHFDYNFCVMDIEAPCAQNPWASRYV